MQSRTKKVALMAAGGGLYVASIAAASGFLPRIGEGSVQCDGACSPPESEQAAAIEQLVPGAVVAGVVAVITIVVAMKAVHLSANIEVENE